MSNAAKISLDRVELIAVSSTQINLTERALYESARGIEFASVKLVTHESGKSEATAIERIHIAPLTSSAAYSHFMLKRLADIVEADFALVVQWDGYVLNPTAWHQQFLNYDYIGARWPHFDDDFVVGNGGFSLRSRNLLRACQDSRILCDGPEDLVIGRTYRRFLEDEFGIRFASPTVADAFSFERTEQHETFGFHGVFNLVNILGSKRFGAFYRAADPTSIGDRELRDCLLAALKAAPWRERRLAFHLLRDWLNARQTRSSRLHASEKEKA